jgi:hypothetical protein
MRTIGSVLLVLSAAVSLVKAQLGDCDPLDPALCVLPYPNDFWLRAPPQGGPPVTTFTNNTWPKSDSGTAFDVSRGWNGVDGFSPAQPTVTYMANVNLDFANIARVWDINESLSRGCVSALINAETGERVAHWVELDHSSDSWDVLDPADDLRALMAWPALRLNDSTRYIMAYGPMFDTNGAPIAPSAAFQALRDNTSSPDPSVNARRAHFEQDIFPLVAKVGLLRQNLTLAWDFTTASDVTWTGDMVSIRDQVLSTAGKAPQYSIVSTTPSPRPGAALEIHGLLTAPWFISSTVSELGVHVVHNPTTGKPQQQGDNEIPFTVIVPESVANGSMQASAVYYGHGLFGSQKELEDQYLNTEANE